MKNLKSKTLLLLVAAAATLWSCDDDGLTEGDPNYWTSSRGQFTATIDDGTTMFFLRQSDGTASVTFDGSNPNHWTSETTVTPSVTTYQNDVVVPSTVNCSSEKLSVTAIGEEAFMACKAMKTCTIPESVTSIGQGAFCLCTTMTSVNIPNGVTAIPSATFGRCAKLTEITIPEGVKTIGRTAFYGCTSLKKIHCKATTPPVVQDETVFNSVNAVVYVPAGSEEAYASADYWKNFEIRNE